jgi:hypothetical protein
MYKTIETKKALLNEEKDINLREDGVRSYDLLVRREQ